MCEITEDSDYRDLAAEFDLEMLGGEDAINLGSTEEFFGEFGVEVDEWLIDGLNEWLNKRGLNLIDEHGQLILEEY